MCAKISKYQELKIKNEVVENLKGTIVEFCLNSDKDSHLPIKNLITQYRTTEESINTEDIMEQLFNSPGVPSYYCRKIANIDEENK